MGFTLDKSTIRELAAAIAAEVVQALRAARSATAVTDDREIIQVGPLEVDLGRMEAALAGRALDLKPRELALLAALARNAGRALSRAQLLELAWDDAALGSIESDRTVDVHVRRLRLRLGDNAAMLQTVSRVGYRLDPCPNWRSSRVAAALAMAALSEKRALPPSPTTTSISRRLIRTRKALSNEG